MAHREKRYLGHQNENVAKNFLGLKTHQVICAVFRISSKDYHSALLKLFPPLIQLNKRTLIRVSYCLLWSHWLKRTTRITPRCSPWPGSLLFAREDGLNKAKTMCRAVWSVDLLLSLGGASAVEKWADGFLTYMRSYFQGKDRGHSWAAGGLCVDKNREALSTLKPCIFKYFMTPSSPAPFIRFMLWLEAAFH